MSKREGRGLRLKGKHLFCSLFILFVLCSCSRPSKDEPSDFGLIQYNINIYPESDEPWEIERTQNFDQKKFVDFIFEKLYSKELQAYDFFTEEKLTVEYLSSFEKEEGFSRDFVSRVQFNESWVWLDGKLQREIRSITFSYKLFDHFGEIRGHKPIFKINYR